MISSCTVRATGPIAALVGSNPDVLHQAKTVLVTELSPGEWRVLVDDVPHHQFFREVITKETIKTISLGRPKL